MEPFFSFYMSNGYKMHSACNSIPFILWFISETSPYLIIIIPLTFGSTCEVLHVAFTHTAIPPRSVRGKEEFNPTSSGRSPQSLLALGPVPGSFALDAEISWKETRNKSKLYERMKQLLPPTPRPMFKCSEVENTWTRREVEETLTGEFGGELGISQQIN